MSGDTWSTQELLELHNELLKGQLDIDIQGEVRPQLLKRRKEIEERFKRHRAGQARQFCVQVMVIQ
jgi:hypothetical protein